MRTSEKWPNKRMIDRPTDDQTGNYTLTESNQSISVYPSRPVPSRPSNQIRQKQNTNKPWCKQMAYHNHRPWVRQLTEGYNWNKNKAKITILNTDLTARLCVCGTRANTAPLPVCSCSNATSKFRAVFSLSRFFYARQREWTVMILRKIK